MSEFENIDLYYESLKAVYSQIEAWDAPKRVWYARAITIVMVIAIILLVFSIIPIVPAAIIFLGRLLDWHLWVIELKTITLGQIGLIWLTCIIGSGILTGLTTWLDGKTPSIKPEQKSPPYTLSSEQLTFLTTYEAFKELKLFFVSRIDQHIINASTVLSRITFWRKISYRYPSRPRPVYINESYSADEVDRIVVERILAEEDYQIRSKRYGGHQNSFVEQMEVAYMFLRTFDKAEWFQLDKETKALLQALITFPEKITERLRRREDLSSVLRILENLAKFTYAFLPEHEANIDKEELSELRKAGLLCLNNFVQETNSLTVFPKPEKTRESKAKKQRRRFLELLQGRNIFYRFTVWFFLILLLTTGITLLAMLFIDFSSDTLVIIVIPTSVLGAASMTVLAKGEHEIQPQRHPLDEKLDT